MCRASGIILIVLGIVLLVWTGFTYTKKEKVIDAGPIEVSKDTPRTVNWPPYVGGVVLIAGIIVFVGSKRRA